MTIDINNMTQTEFNNLINDIKEKHPKLYQIICDFVDRKLSAEEVNSILEMEQSDLVDYINNYKVRV
ncbi:hypothetical protein D8810_10275 [Streptococcus gordonii]|nr:hypothetical protein D8810_10275 [Streptococcus gordonii]